MKRIFESKKYPGFWMNKHGVVFGPEVKSDVDIIIGHFKLVDADKFFAPYQISQEIRDESRVSGFQFART
ncbi:MAG: hypothetical protein WC976_06360 [Caldisericia bacterium]